MNDFRQMISLIKLNAFCNYHAGFEEHPIPPFQPEGPSGNTDAAGPPSSRPGPASWHSTSTCPSLELVVKVECLWGEHLLRSLGDLIT